VRAAVAPIGLRAMNNPLEILRALDAQLERPTELEQEPISSDALKTAFAKARVPDLSEFQLIFQEAQPKVLAIARAIEQNPDPR
jgi:hypothetical protein